MSSPKSTIFFSSDGDFLGRNVVPGAEEELRFWNKYLFCIHLGWINDASRNGGLKAAFPRFQMEKQPVSILVVDGNGSQRTATLRQLVLAGYEAAGVGSFADAKARLDTAPPDLLITGVRLGPYNGLHLIVRSRGQLPNMATVLMHDEDDPVLVGEALRNGAQFLLLPCGSEALLQTVKTSLSSHHSARTVDNAEKSLPQGSLPAKQQP